MASLRDELGRALSGRVAWVGLGNPDQGDDGLGLRLAETLRQAGHGDVHLAGTRPESWVFQGAFRQFDQVVFLDAVSFGGEAGAVVFLDRSEMSARFPQVSTHRMSLGLLAEWMESQGATRVWLLGVQPDSLRSGGELSQAVQTTLELLTDLVRETVAAAEQALAAPSLAEGRPWA